MHKSLNFDAATPAQYCEKHYIRRLALFGSRTNGTAGPDSNIDRLAEFDTAHIPGLMGIAGMEIELSELRDQKVNLRSGADLSRCFRVKSGRCVNSEQTSASINRSGEIRCGQAVSCRLPGFFHQALLIPLFGQTAG